MGLGEDPTGKRESLRYGMYWHVDLAAQKAVEGYAMFDLPAAFSQIGVDLYGHGATAPTGPQGVFLNEEWPWAHLQGTRTAGQQGRKALRLGMGLLESFLEQRWRLCKNGGRFLAGFDL